MSSERREEWDFNPLLSALSQIFRISDTMRRLIRIDYVFFVSLFVWCYLWDSTRSSSSAQPISCTANLGKQRSRQSAREAFPQGGVGSSADGTDPDSIFGDLPTS